MKWRGCLWQGPTRSLPLPVLYSSTHDANRLSRRFKLKVPVRLRENESAQPSGPGLFQLQLLDLLEARWSAGLQELVGCLRHLVHSAREGNLVSLRWLGKAAELAYELQ